MRDSVEIELSAKRIVHNQVLFAVAAIATAAGIIFGAFSVWAGAVTSLTAGIVSALYPATATLHEIVKIHTGD
jgi:hypothetical protein